MADSTIEQNAARDAGAMVAALNRGDFGSFHALAAFYTTPQEMSALCGSLAAFAVAILRVIDSVHDEVSIHGVYMPSSNDVLQSVLMKLASDE